MWPDGNMVLGYFLKLLWSEKSHNCKLLSNHPSQRKNKDSFEVLLWFYTFLLNVWLNLKAINFYMIKIDTDVKWQPSYFWGENIPHWMLNQGRLTEVEAQCHWPPHEGSLFCKKVYNIFNLKSCWSKLVSTRRSSVRSIEIVKFIVSPTLRLQTWRLYNPQFLHLNWCVILIQEIFINWTLKAPYKHVCKYRTKKFLDRWVIPILG
jgi:hypothetical protein